jgi:hypothetical protein
MTYFHPEEKFQFGALSKYDDENPGTLYLIKYSDGGLTTHRLFIEYDRETTEIVKIHRVLIEPKLVAALRKSGTLPIRPEPSTVNP